MKKTSLLISFLAVFNFASAQTDNTTSPPSIRKIVEEMPQFPGCETMTDKEKRKQCSDEKMYDFVEKNLLYPAIAKDNGVEGVVVVRFVVEMDGTLTNPEVVRNIGASCGDEALRVVRMMPNWIPGQLRGKAVRTQFNLPVKFKI